MSDELDPLLLKCFEAKRTNLDDAEFIAALLADIDRQQRTASRWQAVLVAALVLVVAWQLPSLLRATAAAVQSMSAQTETYAPLMISPLGWALSMLVGLGVMLRIMPRRI